MCERAVTFIKLGLGLCFSLLFFPVVLPAAPLGQEYPEIRQHIAKLVRLTPAQRLAYMQNHGVEIYSVPVGQGKINHFKTLKTAPEKFASLTKDFADGSTGGLYLTPANAAYQVTVPTILIAQDAEPWALIHEFVHALLDEDRAQSTVWNESRMVLNLEDAREDLNELWWIFKANKASLSEEELTHMLASFIKVAILDSQLLKVVQLEEILIEGLLRQAYLDHKPADFKQETYDYSTYYIKANAKKARTQLQGILDKCLDLVDVAVTEKSILSGNVLRTCMETQNLMTEVQRRFDAALGLDLI